jgi:homospermidine synthase
LRQLKSIEDAITQQKFAHLAQALGIKTVHISERDSQRTAQQKNDNEFLNTWSVVEYINECKAKVEFGWGTHEKKMPAQSEIINNTLFMDRMALDVYLTSCVVHEEIIGMIPPHDETFTIADYFTVHVDDRIEYRPTVIFVYDASPNAKKSIHELAEHDFEMHERYQVMKSAIIAGVEKMGCLIMGNHISWWTGSVLSIEESNRLVPNQNATIMQVAAGVLAALYETIKQPQRGICFPEDLDHTEVLAIAKLYLGDFVSEQVSWKPTQKPTWQFHEFVVDKK